jgi:hypothetical protein
LQNLGQSDKSGFGERKGTFHLEQPPIFFKVGAVLKSPSNKEKEPIQKSGLGIRGS